MPYYDSVKNMRLLEQHRGLMERRDTFLSINLILKKEKNNQ